MSACQECVDTAISLGSRPKPLSSTSEFWESITYTVSRRRCPKHQGIFLENIVVPLLQSYCKWSGIEVDCDNLSIDDGETIKFILQEMGHEYRGIFDLYADGNDEVSVDMDDISALNQTILDSPTVEEGDEETLRQHLRATFDNTGTLHRTHHELDILKLSRECPDVLWSHMKSFDGDAAVSLALKIPNAPLTSIYSTSRLQEWRASFALSRFYGAGHTDLSRMTGLIDNAIMVSSSDSDVAKYLSSSISPMGASGILCQTLFDWTDFISQRLGKEVTTTEAVDEVTQNFRGFLRPQSFKTFSSRICRSTDGEVSDETITKCAQAVAESSPDHCLKSQMQTPVQIDDLISFDMDPERIRRWRFSTKLDRIFNGTKVQEYKEGRRWVRNLERYLDDQQIREYALSGVPLDWILSSM